MSDDKLIFGLIAAIGLFGLFYSPPLNTSVRGIAYDRIRELDLRAMPYAFRPDVPCSITRDMSERITVANCNFGPHKPLH
jgi:hypothetical protein